MTASRLHLLWTVPLALVLAAIGFVVGDYRWCGDDALGCRFGLGSAVQSAIPSVIAAVVVAAIIGVLFAVAPWTGDGRGRRRVALIVGVGYLVLAVGYLIVTLSVNGWGQG